MANIHTEGVALAAAPIGLSAALKTQNKGCAARKCKFYSKHTGSCDYALITGHLRSTICGTGPDCTVCEEGEHREDAAPFNIMPKNRARREPA